MFAKLRLYCWNRRAREKNYQRIGLIALKREENILSTDRLDSQLEVKEATVDIDHEFSLP